MNILTYRCPSCENFFSIDDWSIENDICKLCLDGIEYVEETNYGYSI